MSLISITSPQNFSNVSTKTNFETFFTISEDITIPVDSKITYKLYYSDGSTDSGTFTSLKKKDDLGAWNAIVPSDNISKDAISGDYRAIIGVPLSVKSPFKISINIVNGSNIYCSSALLTLSSNATMTIKNEYKDINYLATKSVVEISSYFSGLDATSMTFVLKFFLNNEKIYEGNYNMNNINKQIIIPFEKPTTTFNKAASNVYRMEVTFTSTKDKDVFVFLIHDIMAGFI